MDEFQAEEIKVVSNDLLGFCKLYERNTFFAKSRGSVEAVRAIYI